VQLLAIDQGNSRTKFGVFADGELRHTWAIPTDKSATSAALHTAITTHGDVHHDTIIAVSSVVSELRTEWEGMAAAAGWPFFMITGTFVTPLINAYHTPETLGPDRLMAAVAAFHRARGPVMPVLLGTATVVDAVTGDGEYLGGLIAPGIGVSVDLLSKNASALDSVTWRPPANAIGRSTREALHNGLFFASIGGLRHMIAAIRHELHLSAPLALSGGWAVDVQSHLDGVAFLDPHLVLHGIAISISHFLSSPIRIANR